jgi:hypothetical protein
MALVQDNVMRNCVEVAAEVSLAGLLVLLF